MIKFRVFSDGIRLDPQNSDAPTLAGEMRFNTATQKIEVYASNAVRALVDETTGQSLSSKTLTAPVINSATVDTLTGIAGNSAIFQSASGQQAIVRSQGTADVVIATQAGNSNIQLNPNGTGKVQVDGTIFMESGSLSSAGNFQFNTTSGDLSFTPVGNSVFDTYLRLKGNVTTSSINTSTGSLSITPASNLTFNPTGTIFSNSAHSFTNNVLLDVQTATVDNFTPVKPFVKLNTITSLTAIAAGAAGQKFTLSNISANAINISNNASIITGTGSSISLTSGASLELIYDSTASAWRIIGGTGSSPTVLLTSGEAFAANTALYLKTSDSRVYKLDNTSDATMEFIGFAADASSGAAQTVRVQVSGQVSGLSGLAVGKPVYATTAGNVTSVAPNTTGYWLIQVGMATSATTMLINPAGSSTAQKIANLKPSSTYDVLAGEALSSNVPVYIGSDGRAYNIDYTDDTKMEFAGFTQFAQATVGQTVTVQVDGEMVGFSGLSVGEPVYASSSGVVSSTPTSVSGRWIIQVGIAKTSSIILINPSGSATAIKVTTDLGPAYTSGGVVFGTGSSSTVDASKLFWDNTNKRLGIGTGSPTSELMIGDPSVGARLELCARNSTQEALVIRSRASDNAAYMRFVNNPFSAEQAKIGITTNSDLYFTTGGSGTERLRIDSNGNVGIANTSPSYALDIIGDARVKLSTATDVSGVIRIGAGTGMVTLASNQNTGGDFNIIAPGGATNFTLTSGGTLGLGISTPLTVNKLHLHTTNDTRIRISNDSGSANVSMGALDFYLWNNSAGSVIFGTSNGEKMRINASGILYSLPTYNNTTGVAANMVVGSDGGMYRSTSSIKYKKDVTPYNKGLADVLKLNPVFYKSKQQTDGDQQFAGFIAEEVEEVGLKEFVQYSKDGSPDALSYANMTALMAKAIQELSSKIDVLQNEINVLKAK